MFNSTKSSDIKDKAVSLKDSTKAAVSDIANDAKETVQELGKRISSRSSNTKGDAEALIESLRELLAEQPIEKKSDEIKARVAEQYTQWKDTLQDEIAIALQDGQARSRKVLNEQPVLTLAVAVGAGALIGYLIGNHNSDNRS
ncbi:MAG: hypothetical protein V4588_05225 [Pseudomonadota bacterium]